MPYHLLTQFKKPKRTVTRAFLHCSASNKPEHDNPNVIGKWHRERGFSSIGYHFVITKDGSVWTGRDIEFTPAAQQGNNRATIAICLTGLAEFSEAQFKSLRDLCHEINEEYESEITFHGHCEVSAKSCPVFDYRQVLNLSPDGRLNQRSA
ncbi:lysozyme [uncultured Caudovirales phage]|uniref:Lysozyme n=1 Tax=uncultured Caudovirales phage TaxID=2100421 RepID=A0A6J5MBI6_9CAUD|nr:lysozyme [uncultured Caudovirales phage]